MRRITDFKGRSPRREYWWFILLWAVTAVVALTLDNLIFGAADADNPTPFFLIACVGLLVPNVGVMVRRYHDLGKSGWWGLTMFIPYVGWLWLVIDMATAGDAGENRFGDPPYGALAARPLPSEPVIRS